MEKRPIRINLALVNRSWCGSAPMLPDVDPIPDELWSTSLVRDRAMVENYLGAKLQKVNQIKSSACWNFHGQICALVFSWFPGVICCYCASQKRQDVAWSTSMKEWEDDFNASVFSKHGMHIKVQSRVSKY